MPIPVSPVGGGITGTEFMSRTSVTQTRDSRLIGVRAYVMDFSSYESAIHELPSTQQLTLSPLLSPKEFESFRDTGSVQVRFTENTPDECRVYLGIGQSRTLIDGRDSGTITMDCTQVSEKTWKISVSSSVSQIDREWLQNHLQSVTIQGAGITEQLAYSTEPSPTPAVPAPEEEANNAATPERGDIPAPRSH